MPPATPDKPAPRRRQKETSYPGTAGQPNPDPASVGAELATSTHFLPAPFPAPARNMKNSIPSGQTGLGSHIGPSELLGPRFGFILRISQGSHAFVL